MDRLYAAIFLLYSVVLVLSLFRFSLLSFLLAAALIVNGWALTLIVMRSGHLPVFNLFESFLLVSFILGLMGLVTRNWGKNKIAAGIWLWIEIVILLGLLWFFPKRPALSRYDYDYFYIGLFRITRVAALASALFSSSHFMRARFERMKSDLGSRHFHQGRNYLLLSAIFFLVSELAGIIWCLNGWGDMWRWNSAFFRSSLILLYFMLVFHIPVKNGQADNVKSLLGGMTGFFMVILALVRGVT